MVKLSGTNLAVQRGSDAAQTFARAAVAKIVATLGDGNDSIAIDDAVSAPASIAGGNGDDTLRGGTGNDTIDGGAGNDTVTYAGRTSAITAQLTLKITSDFDPDSGTSSPGYFNGTGSGGTGSEADSYDFIETIAGGNGDDTITLDSAVVYASYAGSQTPAIRGEGGAGNDRFEINSHSMQGGVFFPGYDDGEIVADGGAGDDDFDASENRDPPLGVSCYGGDGDDTFVDDTEDGSAFFFPGAGVDSVTVNQTGFGSGGTFTIGSDLENVTIRNRSNFTVVGNASANRIEISVGSGVTVRAGAGDDTIVANGIDSIDGGDGNDTVSYAGQTEAVTATVTMEIVYDPDPDTGPLPSYANGHGTSTIGSATDTYAFIETIVGGDGDDTLLGQNGRDFMQGNTGADYLIGGGGNDVLSVDAGSDGLDTLSGNGGSDEAYADVSALLSSIALFHPH